MAPSSVLFGATPKADPSHPPLGGRASMPSSPSTRNAAQIGASGWMNRVLSLSSRELKRKENKQQSGLTVDLEGPHVSADTSKAHLHLIGDAHATCLVHGPAQPVDGHHIQTHKR